MVFDVKETYCDFIEGFFVKWEIKQTITLKVIEGKNRYWTQK